MAKEDLPKSSPKKGGKQGGKLVCLGVVTAGYFHFEERLGARLSNRWLTLVRSIVGWAVSSRMEPELSPGATVGRRNEAEGRASARWREPERSTDVRLAERLGVRLLACW